MPRGDPNDFAVLLDASPPAVTNSLVRIYLKDIGVAASRTACVSNVGVTGVCCRLAVMALLLSIVACARQNHVEVLTAEAVAGDPSSQYELGWRFLEGDGVSQNEDEAEKWLLQSARQGYGLAQHRLGVVYRDRHGPEAQQMARSWLEAAQADGYQSAETALAELLASSPSQSLHDGNRAIALMEPRMHKA